MEPGASPGFCVELIFRRDGRDCCPFAEKKNGTREVAVRPRDGSYSGSASPREGAAPGALRLDWAGDLPGW
ncbi:hypothetical protein FRX31_023014, partial [Thalictrum thalictroides]